MARPAKIAEEYGRQDAANFIRSLKQRDILLAELQTMSKRLTDNEKGLVSALHSKIMKGWGDGDNRIWADEIKALRITIVNDRRLANVPNEARAELIDIAKTQQGKKPLPEKSNAYDEAQTLHNYLQSLSGQYTCKLLMLDAALKTTDHSPEKKAVTAKEMTNLLSKEGEWKNALNECRTKIITLKEPQKTEKAKEIHRLVHLLDVAQQAKETMATVSPQREVLSTQRRP